MSLLKKCNFKCLLRRHQQLMSAHPMVMNSIQTSLLMTAGDITAQELVEKKGKHYDPMRTARMGCIGLMLGPAITLWYRGLDRMFGSEMTMRSALMKVAFVEVFLTPPGLAGILIADALLEEKPVLEVLKKKFLRMLAANYIYWPTSSFAIFRFSPGHSRVLWTTVLSFGWNVIMAWMINTDVADLEYKRIAGQSND
ncbi:hypothetical protein GE061_006318 [Apolygus lucorum]|uniref:Mitochondrial inner membrane protein Mpv17 n=1 Tax=Apolygus lucorum TaxID=248454 RepID=A0A6A4JBL4_APOLU|nr:hypothetical protein GE061_006318 [Apolygus lucorum]